MKVYIITEGEYSDYHIERVFLDRAKAEAYTNFHPFAYIEEYETDDDNFVVPSTVFFRTTAVFWIVEDADNHFHTFPAVSPSTMKLLPGEAWSQSTPCRTQIELSCRNDYVDAAKQILTMKITRTAFAPSTETDFTPFEDRVRKIAYDTAAQVEEFFVESGASDFSAFVKLFMAQHPYGVIPESDSDDDDGSTISKENERSPQ